MEAKAREYLPTAGSGDLMEDLWASRYELPTLPQSYVSRSRLLAILEPSDRIPLVLVSAAAGAGKTLMTAEWVGQAGADHLTVWIRFEGGDITTFWSDIARALTLRGVELASAGPLNGAHPGQREDLVRLCAAVARHPQPVRLVLDDLDLTDARLASEVEFFLRHANHNLQLVITSRVDPVLPVYRYRLEDSVVEVRTADLAFTLAESAQLLETCGVHLADESIRALHTRTEGWVAGLRFAAMFMSRCADPDEAALAISGDTGNIAEYLIGEVLKSQSPTTRQLLLNTSVADTLQPGLIEELGGPGAPRELARLTRENTFIDQRLDLPGTYSYHPLFKDVLRAELSYAAPKQWRLLNHRAAAWFAERGMLTRSVAHVATVNAWGEAAKFVVDDLALGQLVVEQGSGALTAALNHMPADVNDAQACVVRAAIALGRGDFKECDAELGRAVQTTGDVDSPENSALLLAISLLTAVRGSSVNEPEAARRLAEAAENLLLLPTYHTKLASHPEVAALVHTSKGIACVRNGQFADAMEAFAVGEAAARKPGCERLLAECNGFLALISALNGRLTRADALAARSIGVSDSIDAAPIDRPPSALVARAWVALERLDLPAAAENIRLARLTRFLPGDPVSRTFAVIIAARLLRGRADIPGAIAITERACAQAAQEVSWLTERLMLELSTLRIAAGDAVIADPALRTMGSPVNQAEIALATAQSQVAQGKLAGVDAQLRLATSPSAPLRTRVAGSLVELEHSLIEGDTHNAHVLLERSLRLAAPETLRRPFREASPAVKALMRKESVLLAHHPWLDGNSLRGRGHPDGTRVGTDSMPGLEPEARVVEPLTGKEMEVLSHLAELLSTDEIAEAMFVSANTIRTHVRSILRKLGVSRRNEAVRRARKLSLINA